MFWFVVAQVFGFVLDLVALRGHSDREKDLEILLLRQQLRIVERKQVQRRGLSRWGKLSLAVLLAWFNAVSRGSGERLREVMRLFQPETVLKWHRELVRRKWTYARAPKPRGNAPLSAALETLIVQLACDNARFGYKKLVGELGKVRLPGRTFDRTRCPQTPWHSIGTGPCASLQALAYLSEQS